MNSRRSSILGRVAKREKPETKEAKMLCAALDARGISYVWVSNLTTSAANAEAQKAKGMQPGFPDYLILLPGRVLFWELKPPNEEPRPDQYEWQDRLGRLGYGVGWGTAEEAITFVDESTCRSEHRSGKITRTC